MGWKHNTAKKLQGPRPKHTNFLSHNLAVCLAIMAGIVLGAAAVSSRYAFDAGANGLMVSLLRSVIMVIVLYSGLKAAGFGLGLPKDLWWFGILNGILMAAMTYGNIGAIEFIPIGLAQLIFFTFPVIIALVVGFLGIESVTKIKLICVFAAFLGLTLMLVNATDNLDWRGVAFALTAAITTAINAIIVSKYFREVNAFVTAFNFSVVALFVLGLIGIFVEEPTLPESLKGWCGAIGVGLLQTIGTPMYLYALAKIGALKTGMAANIQPVFAIFAAWLLFNEILTLQQAIGGLLVLAAITSLQYIDLRGRFKKSEK